MEINEKKAQSFYITRKSGYFICKEVKYIWCVILELKGFKICEKHSASINKKKKNVKTLILFNKLQEV